MFLARKALKIKMRAERIKKKIIVCYILRNQNAKYIPPGGRKSAAGAHH
jgi:hypothetical protein